MPGGEVGWYWKVPILVPRDLHRVQKALLREPASSPGQGPDGGGLALTVRCALCIASVDEIARSTPVELIGPLVKHKIWGRNGALRYARSIADPQRRGEALIYLASIETEPTTSLVLQEAFEALAQVPAGDVGDAAKATILGELAPGLPPGVLGTALDLALSISGRSCMAQAVVALLPRLSTSQVKQLLVVTRGVADTELRQRLLGQVAATHPSVAVAQATEETLNTWERAWSSWVRATAFPMYHARRRWRLCAVRSTQSSLTHLHHPTSLISGCCWR